MGFAVRAFEETPGRARRAIVGLHLVSRQVRAADLIRHWVDLTLAKPAPTDRVLTAARHAHPDELALHPDRRDRHRRPAAPEQETAHARALAAFSQGRIILLVDDRQIEDPDTRLGLTDDTEVTFLRLMPLVGG
jgi:hypothetical protein